VISASDIDRTLAALSDPTRRAVIDLLRTRPQRAGELASDLALGPAMLSRHLRVLRKAGLVANSHPENDARVRVYRLEPHAFASLRIWLEEVEAFWGGQLEAFAEHMDNKSP
jgi:DNA-binding transcriptional ArsR family regulator